MATLTNINFRGRVSGCSLLILFYLTVLRDLIITRHAEASSYVDHRCTNSSLYAKGSDFQRNLNIVLKNLVNDTSKTGYNTSVSGKSPHKVYGLLQCRGDATAKQCYNCSQAAAIMIPQKCGKAVGGKIWFDLCYLHYDNYSFFGQLDNSGRFEYSYDNASNPDAFNLAMLSLFTELLAEAVAAPSKNLYASGTTNASFSPKIYGLVQCTRDISSDNCTDCILDATTYFEGYYRGSTGVSNLAGSCIVIYDISPFFNSTARAVEPANTPVVTPSTSNSSDHSNKIPTIAGVLGGGLLLTLLICLVTIRRRMKGYEVNEPLEGQTTVVEERQILHEQVEEDALVSEDRQILTFKMETLVAATKKFHDDHKLGEGGFGPVYKGITRDGKEIAVKKLSLNSNQGKKEFLTEVKLVAKIQHRNLVKLLGCCAKGSEWLLVYEYLPNSSLDKILFDHPIKRKMLDWQKRYNIILGVVRGLLYLHEDSQPRIIHRDIKASNILLDENLNPKIADFGLAKLLPQDKSSVSTLTKVAGTLGYMAPEYAMHGQLSAKADVYSFGVLLMELVTGRKNMDYNLPPEMQLLLGWAWRSYEAGNSVEIIDPVAIIESGDEEQALKCIQVAIWCTQADPSLRPTMFTVSSMLSSHSVTVPYLTKPVCANSVPRFNTRNSGSGYGLSHHSSATTSSALSDPVPASSSNAAVSTIELVPR